MMLRLFVSQRIRRVSTCGDNLFKEENTFSPNRHMTDSQLSLDRCTSMAALLVFRRFLLKFFFFMEQQDLWLELQENRKNKTSISWNHLPFFKFSVHAYRVLWKPDLYVHKMLLKVNQPRLYIRQNSLIMHFLFVL